VSPALYYRAFVLEIEGDHDRSFLSSSRYGRIISFKTIDPNEIDHDDDDVIAEDDLSNTEVQIAWYWHASSQFGGPRGFFNVGSFSNQRELVRSETPSDWWPLSLVLRPITVELCDAIPVDETAMFFSR